MTGPTTSLLLFSVACGLVVSMLRKEDRWFAIAMVTWLVLACAGAAIRLDRPVVEIGLLHAGSGLVLLLSVVLGIPDRLRFLALPAGAVAAGFAVPPDTSLFALSLCLLGLLVFIPAAWFHRRGWSTPVYVFASWVAVVSILGGSLAIQAPSGVAVDHRL